VASLAGTFFIGMLLSGEVERRQASKPEDASHPEFTATLRLRPRPLGRELD
jgi:hypothetical protein